MTATARPDWAIGLIDLLEQQRAIYEQLQTLSHRQSELVASGDAEPLLSVLSQRQRLIDDLTQLNGQLEPYKQNWPALWARLDSDTQKTVQGLIDQVQLLLGQIVAQDEKDRVALSAQRERTSSEIKQLRTGSAINRAYGRPQGAPDDQNRYTDQQG